MDLSPNLIRFFIFIFLKIGHCSNLIYVMIQAKRPDSLTVSSNIMVTALSTSCTTS